MFFMVKDAGLTPDLLSYAAALQCMGRLDQDTNTIKRCLEQMARDGLQLQKLFTEVSLSKEERDVVLKAVAKAEPTVSPPPQPPPQVNTSTLLKGVYTKGGPVSYPKLHLPLQTLKDLFQQQLHVELTTSVYVQSVEKAPSLTKEMLQAVRVLGPVCSDPCLPCGEGCGLGLGLGCWAESREAPLLASSVETPPACAARVRGWPLRW